MPKINRTEINSSDTCCFQSRIISTMMPANQLRRKRNSLKIVKINRNAEYEPTHLQFRMGMALLLFKRRGEKLSLSFYIFYIKVTRSSVERIRFSCVIFSRLRLSDQMNQHLMTNLVKNHTKHKGTE